MFNITQIQNKIYYLRLFKKNKYKIREVYDNLNDKKSIKVLEMLLKARTSIFRNAEYYYNLVKEPNCNVAHFITEDGYQVYGRKNQYFLHEIFDFEKEKVLLDGGAYIGDTINEFLNQTKGNVHSIYCFEPDIENFRKLQLYISNSSYKKLIRIYNIGLDNKDGYKEFSSSGAGSRISKDGEKIIKVVNSQNFINSHIKDTISFIKLDIEGKEKDVLINMRRYIAKYKPDLAISIYHSFVDLWEIPLLIKDICPDYKIYIRHNSNYFTETVCYATVSKFEEKSLS